MRTVLAGLLSLALVADVAAQAPTPPAGKLPVPLLQPGKVARTAGTDQVTVYAFDGGSGLSIRLKLKLAGEGALVLHTPDGTPMLERTGAGSVDLAAILPGEDVHYVSVLRAQTAQPATLTLEVTEPDLHLAVFSAGIGYAWRKKGKNDAEYEVKTCWVEPGLKFRRVYPTVYEEGSLGRGGKEYGSWRFTSGKAGTSERTATFADGNVTYHLTDGRGDQVRKIDDALYYATPDDRYYRYLCRDDDK